MPENILIIGSGALACLFAARLTLSGQQITLTGSWEAGMAAIQKNGIGLMELGKVTYSPVTVLDLHKSLSEFQTAILLTKAYQTGETLLRVQSCLPEDGSVLSLQNGLTARNRMIEIIGERRSLSGITTCAAEQLEPGIVKHNGGSSIFLGDHPGASKYQELFLKAGFSITVTSDIQKMIWEKAIINSAVNPLGAILRLRNGEMMDQPDLINIMDELIREACAVAGSEGCQIEPVEMQGRLRHIMNETSTNRCSMLQDVIHGRVTEIDDINGAIVRLANKNGIPTPVQNTVTQLVRSIKREVN
jgi:2-dehydropantoate 2-reductase